MLGRPNVKAILGRVLLVLGCSACAPDSPVSMPWVPPPASKEAHGAGLEPLPLSGWFRVELTSDSIWETCKLTISIDEKGAGFAVTECGVSAPGKLTTTAALSRPEMEELRTLLRAADLFQGQFWGQDDRPADLALVTLIVTDESRIAALVCSKNDSFESGGRRRLLAFLTARLRAGRPGAK